MDGRPFRSKLSRSHALRKQFVACLAEGREEETDDAAMCVSRTKLFDRTRRESDPCRYVDTIEIPYITLPLLRIAPRTGVSLGDYAVVVHPVARKYCFAVVGDGRDVAAVEPSLYLADALGLNGSEELLYLIFPDTGEGQGTIPSIERIQESGERLFRGGVERSWSTILADCFAEKVAGHHPAIDCTLAHGRSRIALWPA